VVGGQKYASGTDRIADQDLLTRHRRVAGTGEDMHLNRRFKDFTNTLSDAKTNRTECFVPHASVSPARLAPASIAMIEWSPGRPGAAGDSAGLPGACRFSVNRHTCEDSYDLSRGDNGTKMVFVGCIVGRFTHTSPV
jgi:hypothetical protein